MAHRIDEFFIPDNEITADATLDYSRADQYVRAALAFSRSTYQSVYIIDYFRQNFLYVSDNPMLLCGLTAKEVMELGYGFYLKYVPEDEQKMLLEINRAGFDFHHLIPAEERAEWYITYDFHLLNNGCEMLINHKLTSLELTPNGRVWLALCVVSPSNHTTPGHIRMHREGDRKYFSYNRLTRRWDERTMPSLTEAEQLVLKLSMQGLTMNEIADCIFRSPDSVKKYRQNIFEKLNVRNITEAIAAAADYRLI